MINTIFSQPIFAYLNYPSWLHPEVFPGWSIPRWYSLMYILAFVSTYFLMRYQFKKGTFPHNEEQIQNCFLFGIISMLIFIRLFFVIIYDNNRIYYLQNPWMIYWPFRDGKFTGLQGLSYHGGVIGFILGILVFSRIYKFKFFVWTDALTASIPLGYTFGRLGNFFNGELYGRVTDKPWGMLFPQAETVGDLIPTRLAWVQDMAERLGLSIDGALINLPRHPSQFYEAFGEGLLLWVILWFFVHPRRPYNGFTSGIYLIGYSVVRFFLEYLRQPDSYPGYLIQMVPGDIYTFNSFGNISTGQVLSFIMMIGGFIVLAIAKYIHLKEQAMLNTKQTNSSKKSGAK